MSICYYHLINFLYLLGEHPIFSVKTLVKLAALLYPTSFAISAMEWLVVINRMPDLFIRIFRI